MFFFSLKDPENRPVAVFFWQKHSHILNKRRANDKKQYR
jgi:hypothetical protein